MGLLFPKIPLAGTVSFLRRNYHFLFYPNSFCLAVNKFAKLYSINNEAWNVYHAHDNHKTDDAVCPLCRQVS